VYSDVDVESYFTSALQTRQTQGILLSTLKPCRNFAHHVELMMQGVCMQVYVMAITRAIQHVGGGRHAAVTAMFSGRIPLLFLLYCRATKLPYAAPEDFYRLHSKCSTGKQWWF
jgi:hypothetical protein